MRDTPALVYFQDGTKVEADLPRSTTDPRYKACGTHRTACDCREAEYREELAELRRFVRMADAMRDAIQDQVADHGDACHCGPCKIVNAIVENLGPDSRRMFDREPCPF